MDNPHVIAFRSAQVLRNCRVSLETGRVDLVLLPKSGPKRLVLVEAKSSASHDAASKVIGQLLMYYSGALQLGYTGLEALGRYERENKIFARSTSTISPKALSGGISPPEKAFDYLYRGKKLQPKDIALFVAIDGSPHRALKPTIQSLYRIHQIDIGLIVVEGKRKIMTWHPA